MESVELQQEISTSSAQTPHSNGDNNDDGVKITCFSEELRDSTVHFQIIGLQKQIYAWIGCQSAKLGHLYAAATTRPNNTVSITSILGGTSDNTGTGIARRVVLKTGLNIILACDIPKNNPMLEVSLFLPLLVDIERIFVQKLISLGYTASRPQHCR
ncbi:hypothetical protein GIB67_021618 [Kingdonia uniflora]|uniref:Proteasome assembly chaperone 4 n=1 Tax=Kingdonia uniflora TaxID=39325 RepID=A0A7J7MDM2_9MAGN|nr:hypothetical protein GIB67_021618 [Kingdonia uniflora]